MAGKWWFVVVFQLCPAVCFAATTVVAVASNFSHTANEIGGLFNDVSGHQVTFVSSSSGKLFAQISQGAPFDVFLSADVERPRRLESMGLAVPGSRFTYATGRLALWSTDARYLNKDCKAALLAGNLDTLAMANPDIAPYGIAAQQVLDAIGYGDNAGVRIARGESVAQTYQFVASGAASMGFVAAPQLVMRPALQGTCRWAVPESMHAPISQQAVLLTRAKGNPAARAFLAFLASEQASAIIAAHGYGVD